MARTHKDMLLKLEQLEKKQALQDTSIKQLLQYMKLFVTEKQKQRPQIGFKVK
jgi:cytochrome c1